MIQFAARQKSTWQERAERETGLSQNAWESDHDYQVRLARTYQTHLAYKIAGQDGIDLLESLSRAGRIDQ